MFPEITLIVECSTPIHWNDPTCDIPVDARIRPMRRRIRIAMLDRVVVDIAHVAGKVSVIADQVFPIAALPNTTFAFAHPDPADTFTSNHATGKVCFDKPLPRGVVVVARRQRP
jgi:hypothetical protein